MVEVVSEPTTPSQSSARLQGLPEGHLGNNSVEPTVLENPMAEVHEHNEDAATVVPKHDDDGMAIEAGHATNVLEVPHLPLHTPATDFFIGQSNQSPDSDLPGSSIQSPMRDDEIEDVVPPGTGSDALTVEGNTPSGLGPLVTGTQSPDTPAASEDLGTASDKAELAAPLRVTESLGLYGIMTLVAGHVGLVGVFAFFIFLWFGFGQAPEAANATQTWRHIALSNWMAQSITLASLVLRFLVTLQATTCTSMIAALILERRGMRKSYLPWFSVMRGINSGPLKLFRMLLKSRSLAIASYPEFWLALVAIIVTTALQFSSTVLLSDLHDFVIAGDYSQIKVPSLISYDKKTFDIHLIGLQYQMRDPVFATFGEVVSTSDSTPNDYGLSDTGLLQRGFLPFADPQTRTSTRNYNGNAMVMSSRVSCMRPNINGSYEYGADRGNFQGSGWVSGILQYASSLQEAQVKSAPPCPAGECEEEGFHCEVPSSTYGDWQGIACSLDWFGITPGSLSLQPKWESSDPPWGANSSAYLLINTNMRDEDWSQASESQPLPEAETYGEWSSYRLLPDRYMNITLCFMGVALDRKSVKMSSSGNLHEPVVDGSLISTEYNTEDIQRLFGVDGTRKTISERGILDMTIVGEPQDGPVDGQAYETISVGDARNITIAKFTSAIIELVLYAQAIQSVGANTTLGFCNSCSIVSGALFDEHFSDVLTDIIRQPGQAANTLMTYITILSSTIYYDYLKALSMPEEAGATLTTSVRVPGQCSVHGCRGFITVAVLLAVHLTYVCAIAVLYIKEVRYSRYDNIWHATSQLVAGESKETWEKSNNASDDYVIKSLRREQKDSFVKLGHLGSDGQIGFTTPKTQDPSGGNNGNGQGRLAWLKYKLLRKDRRS